LYIRQKEASHDFSLNNIAASPKIFDVKNCLPYIKTSKSDFPPDNIAKVKFILYYTAASEIATLFKAEIQTIPLQVK
jgi:hypothetical protein